MTQRLSSGSLPTSSAVSHSANIQPRCSPRASGGARRIEDIDDPELLRKHVRLAILEREYFKQRAKELREELDKLKGLTPAEQLEFQQMKQAEHLAKLRHKVFGDSSERRKGAHPPGPEPAAKPKTGHGPTPQPRLPTREEHHRLPDDQRTCPACNGTLEEMGEVTEDAEEITVERRRFTVVKHKRHKYRTCSPCPVVT